MAHHNQNLKPYATHIFELICIYFLFDSTVTEILFENFLLVTENLFWILQTPKATVEIGKLNVDISKVGGSESDLLVRVHILPIVVSEPQVSCNQLSDLSGGECSASSQASIATIKKAPALFICEKFCVSCEFGHDRY